MIERISRKYGKRDIFEVARQSMEFRLIQIQQDILRRFNSGEQRETMRKTMNELLLLETTLQGKIQKLITISENLQLVQLEQQTEDCSETSQISLLGRREGSYRTAINQSTQYSGLKNHRKKIEKDHSNLSYQNYCSQSGFSSYRRFSNCNNEEFSLKEDQDGDFYNHQRSEKRSEKKENKSLLSLTQKEGPIETQGTPSPIKRSPSKNNRSSLESCSNSSVQLSKHQPLKQSNQKSKSRQSKSLSRKSNKMKSFTKGSKLNYDGISLVYEGSLHRSMSKQSQQGQKSRVVLSKKTLQKLYNRILRRIQLSRCVVDIISHSNSTVNSAYLTNRYKNELLSRNELTKDIKYVMSSSSKWRY